VAVIEFVRECEAWGNLGLHPHAVSCYYGRILGGIPRVFAEYCKFPGWPDWDETARPYLEVLLAQRTQCAMSLPTKISGALRRRGIPAWTEEYFQQLLATVRCAGFGWLRPEGVKRELLKMAANWQRPAAGAMGKVNGKTDCGWRGTPDRSPHPRPLSHCTGEGR
jgi:hypothetical protein